MSAFHIVFGKLATVNSLLFSKVVRYKAFLQTEIADYLFIGGDAGNGVFSPTPSELGGDATIMSVPHDGVSAHTGKVIRKDHPDNLGLLRINH